jgi:hypothetical protein
MNSAIESAFAELIDQGFEDVSLPDPENIASIYVLADTCFKSSTRYKCGDSEKHQLERKLGGYISRTDAAVALAMKYPFKIEKGIAIFKCKRIASA